MWTLILVFALQQGGYLTSATIPGFNSLADCSSQGEIVMKADKNGQVILAKWVCVDTEKKEIKK